jgi:hypothetical protein
MPQLQFFLVCICSSNLLRDAIDYGHSDNMTEPLIFQFNCDNYYQSMEIKMSGNWGPPAHNFVPEYQQSGIPFVTSSASNEVTDSPVKITFPYVTRWIDVYNTDGVGADTLRFGFTENGVNAVETANYLVLSGGQSTSRLELKCKEVWFRRHGSSNTSFSLIAGLTNVPSPSFPVLSGSIGVAGVG